MKEEPNNGSESKAAKENEKITYEEVREETEKETKKAKNSNLKYVANFLYTFIATLLVIAAVAFIALRVTNINLFSVSSGSMEPDYPTGSVVFVKEVAADTIEENDVITYVFNEDGVLVTHRVIAVDNEEQTFITKGDANNEADPSPVLWGNLVGKVVFCMPNMGAVLDFITGDDTKPIIIAVVAAIGVVSITADIIDRIRLKKKPDDNK